MPAMDRMQMTWQPGSLATSEEDFVRLVVENGMPREKLVTVKGFYDRTLTPELKAASLPAKAAVIYVDCDLYSSTVPVLEWVKDFLQRGTLLVFDDWFCFYGDPDYGERRAFREFRERYPNLRFQEFVHTNEAQAFIYQGELGESGEAAALRLRAESAAGPPGVVVGVPQGAGDLDAVIAEVGDGHVDVVLLDRFDGPAAAQVGVDEHDPDRRPGQSLRTTRIARVDPFAGAAVNLLA